MADIIHRIGIKAPAAKVYRALATIKGVAGWWTKETLGASKKGGTLIFRFRDGDGQIMGEMHGKVAELKANHRVRWRVLDGPPDWIGTDLTFDLSRGEGGQTIVIFGHRGWKKSTESMAHCSMKWATFLLSLRQLVQTGKGRPAPDDLKIDDWN